MNKVQKPRIVCFVCSPVHNEETALVKLGKKLRKNKVALDIITYGQLDNVAKLQALVEAANNSGNSHFVNLEGVTNVTDGIIATPVIHDMGDAAPEGQVGADPAAAAAPGGAAPAGGQFAEFGGVDPNLDPALADAIRMSLEEAKQAEQAEPDSAAQPDAPAQDAAEAPAAPADQPAAEADAEMEEEDEAALIAQAIALSKMEDEAPAPA